MGTTVVEVRDLIWGFDNHPPSVRVGPDNSARNGRSEQVDPCAGYAHPVPLVEKWAKVCDTRFPVPTPPRINVLHHDTLGRTNGWTSFETDYEAPKDENNNPPEKPFIVLVGKRIPILPAMTRYLVTHEYGHVVDGVLARKRYREFESSWKAEAAQDKEYKALRKMTADPKYYGPGQWHLAIGEVFANDFRILVCGVESEFWPHPCTHPTEDSAVIEWWTQRLKEVGTYEQLMECKCGICIWCKRGHTSTPS